MADKFDASIDSMVRSQELVRIRHRDRIKAEYRAGLTAGGTPLDGDWIDWLTDQMDRWPDDEVTRAARVEVSTPQFRNKREYLPHYWLHREPDTRSL